MATGQDNTSKWLIRVCVGAGIAFTSYIEHHMADEVLGVDPAVAVAFPVVLDTYMVAAMRGASAAEKKWAFGLAGAVQVMAAITSVWEPDDVGKGVLLSLLGVVVVAVMWRVHEVLHNQKVAQVPEKVPAAPPRKRTSKPKDPEVPLGPGFRRDLGVLPPEVPEVPKALSAEDPQVPAKEAVPLHLVGGSAVDQHEEAARRLDAEHRAKTGRPVSAKTLKKELSIGTTTAARLVDRIRVDTDTEERQEANG